ncbi:MAG: glycosyltransferase [Victivallaceae bacterium]|nr:glycosyltransferase [Victivallaceae bacterium]
MAGLENILAYAKVKCWKDISAVLDQLQAASGSVPELNKKEFSSLLAGGAAFVTYDFGIDGVSIEIAKYAAVLEQLFPGIPLHFIGGDFHDKADVVLKDHWHRFKLDGFNGWDKWFDGKPFARLFQEAMPEGSAESGRMAREIWKQASALARKLDSYFHAHKIKLAIPVNISSNPGNVAATLGFVLAAEAAAIYVISSNHDYYWEGGKPAAERRPDEQPGPRDHFFRNLANRDFFQVFTRLYPWNGQRWIQANINRPQSRMLIERFGFPPDKVFELGTSISDRFFIHSTPEHVRSVRARMNYIVSDGKPVITTVDARRHLARLPEWMKNEQPIALGNREGLSLDLAADGIFYCLQPTRVILRKHIARDEQLFSALLNYPPFAGKFFADASRRLLLHVTGPTPIEHQDDLEDVLQAYITLCNGLPQEVADRIFLVFSVGNESHPGFEKLNLPPLCIEEIYQLADVVLFPSETEGRGLPIIESSAGGIPIICRRYYPQEVFFDVVGKDLPEVEQIRYLRFPAGEFREDFLADVTKLLLRPETFNDWREHNRKAVRQRYGGQTLVRKFRDLLDVLRRGTEPAGNTAINYRKTEY